MKLHKALAQALARALRREQFDVTAAGIRFPVQGALASGAYFDRINGGAWTRTPNRIVGEGLAHLLNVALGTTAKPQGYYLALFSGAADPQENWKAANFASVAAEVVSMTEGYTAATRPVWTPVNTTGNSIDNMGQVASLTIATASQLNVTGAALLTSSTRGGTTGVLVSATRYAATRTFQDGDTYEVGYRISLTV